MVQFTDLLTTFEYSYFNIKCLLFNVRKKTLTWQLSLKNQDVQNQEDHKDYRAISV